MAFISNLSAPSLFWTVNSILVFIVCVLSAGVLIPQILLISFRRNLFDTPDERKIHQGVVPRLGGIAFKPVVFFSVALLLGVCQLLGYGDMLNGIVSEGRPLAFGFCSIMVLYLVGSIRYRAKFVVQIACGLMLIAGGLWLDNLHGLFLIYNISAWVGWPLTVLAVVFIINAINLIDGIDGLASGLCGVAMLFYGVIFLMVHEYIYAMLAFATLGVLVPFFCYNVFGDAKRGRKIFMGNTGSLTIGMMLCILSLEVCRSFSEDTSAGLPNAFVLAYSPLIIPCFDVVRVYLHRVRNGKNPFLPDKNHIHHKLLAIGMRQRTVMIAIVSVSVFLTLCNILLSTCISVTQLLLADILIWTAANIWLTRKINRTNKKP
ncbi:MraY family glycosyltransferase [Phocaeicola dorei]|uniref:MraY family glycosyltransferase n=1 Tax=Phocaeicola dorei TaxID=357276 RepID=UPI00189F9005|nr:MraY family glycosyltransferase [Phocaeicola dorei]